MKLIPVIHTVDLNQVTYNIDLCAGNDVNKLFLIDHRVKSDSIKKMEGYVNYIRERYPTIKIGVNFLQLDAKDAIIKAEEMKLNFLWADKSHIEKFR